MSTAISSHGYSVRKDKITLQELEDLKDELTVLPFVAQDYAVAKPTPFKIYQESVNKIYLPKSFGLKKFGIPDNNKLSQGNDINLNFVGKLRPEQKEPVSKYLEACKDPLKMGGIISVWCGFGKCLAKDTMVMMYDGALKAVQNIKKGELIMGDDSTQRTVLSTCTGKETLYKIVPENKDHEPYTVNESHILSLKSSTNNQIYDIALIDYINLPDDIKRSMHGYRVPIDFEYKNITIKPYKFGLDFVRVYNRIPIDYKCNCIDVRLQLLAGIIECYGHVIESDHEELIDDIVYLSKSLGLTAYKRTTESGFSTIIEKGYKTTPIDVEKLEKGEYYGFEIDGNRRFVLGDFTITHNTSMAIYIMCELKKKTLIVVHKDFLLQQWKERIEQFAPGAKIGIIKAQKMDIEDKDVVIASLQSLSQKEYDLKVFSSFAFVVYDECHHLGAEVFSQTLKKINFAYSLGLSATPKRKDGLTKVFTWHIGEIVFSAQKRPDLVNVNLLEYFDSNSAYSQEQFMFKGKLNVAKMINNICEYKPRVTFIVQTIKDLFETEPNRKILILSDRRGHVDALFNEIRDNGISVGIYYGGLKEAELKNAESKQIILGTFSFAAEGLDIRGLDTLILASPKSDVIQVVGRILRDKPEDRQYVPLVIDIVDNFSMFNKQAKKRYKYYKSCKYDIQDTNDVFKDRSKVCIPDGKYLFDDK